MGRFLNYLTDRKRSALHLISISLLIVFIAEMVVMLTLHFLPGVSSTAAIFLDSVLLSLIIAPALFYLVFKPLHSRLQDCISAEQEMKKISGDLEHLVEERTSLLAKEVFSRLRAEEESERNVKVQSIINNVMMLSIKKLPLEDMLSEFIHLVTSFPWLSLENKGAFFLKDKNSETLILVAQKGIAPELLTKCAKLPFGRCLCGRAAESKEIVFADCIDDRHDVRFDSMPPHGHYCLPILSAAGDLLGVFTLYTRHGVERNSLVEETLTAVTRVVAGIIEQKQADKDRENLLSQLRQAQKMEAVGTLAGGIAHDFNNILTSILGYADMAMNEIPQGNLARNDIDQVIIAGKRARDLVAHILIFSRQGEQNILPIEISPIIKEALKLLRATLPATIEIKQSINPEAGIIIADPIQIHQILMNLCTNASHAMEQGGVLEISLSSVHLNRDDIARMASPALEPGSYVRLMVSDTGTGMGPDTLERIFEPYFTTKEPGKGTGLGLSVVHGIVTSVNGEITVRSALGEGTVFEVYFPEVEVDEKSGESTSPVPARGKGEHVLVVDDEPPITELIQRILELYGYRITTFTDSREALEAFRKNPGDFDLVITDQAMPGIAGVELAVELMKIRAEIPVILCTGYSELINEEKAREIGISRYFLKPIIAGDLNAMVREVLDESQRSQSL